MANPCRDPHRRCMPLREWPEGDRLAWECAVHTGDLLDEDGAAAHWTPATQTKVCKAYGRWLTFLAGLGDLHATGAPHRRVTRERLSAYLDELRETVTPVTARGRILDLHQAIGVMVPGADLTLLSDLLDRLGTPVPTRDKRAKVLHPAVLFDLGIALMEKARRERVQRAAWQAVRFRDGLMISCLAARPLRRRTFCSLAIDRSLVRTEEEYLLYVCPDETKTHRHYEAPLPAALTALMDEYVQVFRPVLLGCRKSDRLWITHMGTALAPDSFYLRLRAITERELGIGLNPHIFRDCLATGFAIDDPDHVRAAAPLLGHLNLATTNRHYIQATSLEASRQYQDHIALLRKRLRREAGK